MIGDMKKLQPNILLLLALVLLPGCLVNAAFGVMSFMGPPAFQIAGAAYSMAEYSYEYTVNDKTPDQVFLAKVEWLLPEDEGKENPFVPSRLATTESRSMQPMVALNPTSTPERAAPPASNPTVKHANTSARAKTIPMVTRSARAQKINRPTPTKGVPTKRATAQAPALPLVQVYPPREPNPQQIRMDRLESAFRQAETMIRFGADKQGVRLSVPTPAAPLAEQGINGSWSLRHRVMNAVPTNTEV